MGRWVGHLTFDNLSFLAIKLRWEWGVHWCIAWVLWKQIPTYMWRYKTIYWEYYLWKIKGRRTQHRSDTSKGRKFHKKIFRPWDSTTGSSPMLTLNGKPLYPNLVQPLAGSCLGSTHLSLENWGKPWRHLKLETVGQLKSWRQFLC